MYDGPPVVVVGNGPVGQTTALLMARWEIPTVVLDAHPRREVVGSRSICQQRDTLEIWDSVGARALIDSGKLYAPFGTLHPDHDVRAAARRARGEFLTHGNQVVRPDGHVVG